MSAAPASGNPMIDRHSLPLGATSVDAKERAGEIFAAHRLTQDCLILLGSSADRIAESGLAAFENAKRERGRFRAAFWPRADKPEGWFLAALSLPEIGEAAAGVRLRLSGTGARNPIIACLPQATTDSHAFAMELAVRLGVEIDRAAQFLLETFANPASRRLEAISAFLTAILDITAEEDGAIEMLGDIDGEGLLVQGWGRHCRAGVQQLLLAGAVLEQHEAIAGTFPRADLEAPAVGFLALLRPNEAGLRNLPTRLYLRGNDRFRRLAVLPSAARLTNGEWVGQLRSMLGIVQADPGIMRALRSAARPRFDGTDTVATLNRPVRMAVDLAAYVEGGAWYLTGWLLDPANEVQSVTLRGANGFDERLDTRWTRVPRADVVDGFKAEPLFQGGIGHDLHGFTVCVPYFTEPHVWLELRLTGEHYAFVPLAPRAVKGHGGRLALLNSFDLHKSSATDIVERQLGPFLHAAKAGPKHSSGYQSLRSGTATADDAVAVALILPLVDPTIRTNVVVAGLAGRPPGGGAAPLLVCSPELSDKMATLMREIAFYDLDVAIIRADTPIDHCEALELGMRATRAPRLLFLSPSAHAPQAGWAVPLLAALDGGAAAASPTLLYEDWSIRYAGTEALNFQPAAPYAEAVGGGAGYPRGTSAAGTSPTLAAALDCCAIDRAAFAEIGGFSPGYALPAAGGLDFFLRLNAAGHQILWVPAAELYALDEAGASEKYWVRTGELVDGWSLRASWEGRLPAPAAACGDPAPSNGRRSAAAARSR